MRYIPESIRSERETDDYDGPDRPDLTLQQLLAEVSYCRAFARYIKHEQKKSKRKLDYALQLNFLYFCLDVEDYKKIPPENPFRRKFALGITETYLAQQTVHSVSASSSDVRGISKILEDQKEEALSDKLFNAIVTEVV